METFIQSMPAGVFTKAATRTKAKASQLWDFLEYNRYGFTGAILVVIVSFGGIAAAVALGKSMILLAVVGFTSMIVEVMLIAIAPMRWVMTASIIAILVDLFVFAMLV